MFKSIFSKTKSYDEMRSADFAQAIKDTPKSTILDVRTSGEFKSGHLQKAKNIDIMGQDFQGRVSSLDKSKTYFVYCRSGARSGRACGMMSKMGFENVVNLQGGISAWGGKIVR